MTRACRGWGGWRSESVRRGIRMPLRAIGAALLAGFALLLLVLLTQSALAAPHVALSAPNAQQLHSFVAATRSVTAQPTRNDLIQPTAAAATSALPPASTSLGSNGLTIAVILSCVAGALGIIIASVALSALVRGGYGPFLRALLPGRRGAGGPRGDQARLNGHSRSPSPRRPAPTRRR